MECEALPCWCTLYFHKAVTTKTMYSSLGAYRARCATAQLNVKLLLTISPCSNNVALLPKVAATF